MEGFCRVCMGSDFLKDIFMQDQLFKDAPSLVKMLSECVDAEIKPDDKLSKSICISCIQDTQIAFKLKRNYERSSRKVQIKQQILEDDEFIKSLESEEWELIKVDANIKKEQMEKSAPSVETMQKQPEIIRKEPETIQKEQETTRQEQEMNTRRSQRVLLKRSRTVTANTSGDNLQNGSPTSGEMPRQSKGSKGDASSSSPDGITKCKACNKSFRSAYNLQLHMSYHRKRRVSLMSGKVMQKSDYRCLVCLKSFPSLAKLEIHDVVHTGEKPYRCLKCDKSYTTPWSLKKHTMTTHTEKQTHKCARCDKSFASSSNLKAHADLFHSTEHQFKCIQCEMSFTTSESLKSHLELHDGTRIFKCVLCPQTFATRTDLKTHTLEAHINKY